MEPKNKRDCVMRLGPFHLLPICNVFLYCIDILNPMPERPKICDFEPSDLFID